jgi:hypothetical protein
MPVLSSPARGNVCRKEVIVVFEKAFDYAIIYDAMCSGDP